MVALVMVHMVVLHLHGSNNPLGVSSSVDRVPFHPYFVYKDLLGFLPYFGVLVGLVCFYPDVLGHPDNYIEANPLVTPLHIQPEWYFLALYAVLRCVPDKLLGVLAMV